MAAASLIAASPLDEKADALFGRWTAATPGVVVAAEKNGTIVLQRAYGSADLRFGVPMRVTDRFNVGSVAKQFTAFAVYDLIASGKIGGVDDPIGKYVPGLSTLVGSVPIRDLLEHTSGLRDYFALASMSGVNLEDSLDSDGVLRFADAQEHLDFALGTDYEYSNTNYVLLAQAVRHITGKSLDEYLQAAVFHPLGMNDTQLVSQHGIPTPNLVTSYWPAATGGYVERYALLDVQGDGNLITTARDLLKWEENLDTKAVGRATIERMLDRGRLPGSRPASARFVNGLFVERYGGYDRISADGGIAGFRALATTFPKARVSVVALTNLITTFPQDEIDAIAAELLGSALPKATPEAHDRATPTGGTVDAAQYAGRYSSDEIDSTYWICEGEKGQLVVTQLRNAPLSLQPLGGDRFTGDVWWLSGIDFTRSGGHVSGATLSARAVRGVYLRRVTDSCTQR